jgi:hypothetical protein
MWPGAGTIGSPTDPEVGAEGVEPGDLSTVSATLLGAFDGIGRLPTQHRDCGSNSSDYNILGPPPEIDGESPSMRRVRS